VFYRYPDVKIRADVAVLKTGTDNVPLANAEFTLYNASGAVVAVKTTGADGKAAFENLEYGSYTLVETQAPRGYVRAGDIPPIEVTSIDQIDLTIPNVRYVLPQTGGLMDTGTLLAAGGALILAGIVWLIIRRRAHAR